MSDGRQGPEIEVFPTSEAVATHGEEWLADAIRASVDARGRCAMAVSGGHSPWPMLESLARRDDLPWESVWLFQVDERIAPDGDDDRNLTHLREHVLAVRPELASRTHPMPVNDPDLEAAAARYAELLVEVCGTPARLDIIHLGLGPDGHTASLVPGDAVLDVTDRDVALTAGTYQGRRRMTLTYPLIDRAHRIMWQVVGAGKAEALKKMMAGDTSIPGGRVAPSHATVLADAAAAG